MHAAALVGAVMVSCSINVVILEMQIRADPGCTNLITFCQFLFTATIGFIFVVDFGRRKPAIPIRHYSILTTMFFVQSVANNRALSYDISMPLHMIVKSGSLVASMVLGIIFLKAKYPVSKWLAILLVTVGIALCTLASANQPKTRNPIGSRNETSVDSSAHHEDFLSWSIGFSLLLFSVFLASGMGIYQEILFRRFGRHAHEGIFYSHALPLPGFLMLWDDLARHFHIFSASPPLNIPALSDVAFPIPKLWAMLVANILTQYVCSTSVFSLISVCSSLTVTLVITLRKFVSLLISVYLFKNVFTQTHWLGTAFVFVGTVIYVDLVPLPQWRTGKPKTA